MEYLPQGVVLTNRGACVDIKGTFLNASDHDCECFRRPESNILQQYQSHIEMCEK